MELNPANYFHGNTHLFRDAAYSLKTWLLTPFIDNGHLPGQPRRYNEAHRSTRMVVERIIGLLKGQFRKLKTQMVEDDIDGFLGKYGYDDGDDSEFTTRSCSK